MDTTTTHRPEGSWKDAENIKRELQVFFTVREGRGLCMCMCIFSLVGCRSLSDRGPYVRSFTPHVSNPPPQKKLTAEEQRVVEQKKSNPLRSYLGLSDEEQKRIQRRDALIDRDLYSDLRRYVLWVLWMWIDGLMDEWTKGMRMCVFSILPLHKLIDSPTETPYTHPHMTHDAPTTDPYLPKTHPLTHPPTYTQVRLRLPGPPRHGAGRLPRLCRDALGGPG